MSGSNDARSSPKDVKALLAAFEDGHTDLVFPLLASGVSATHRLLSGASLIETCAYYGDVSAIRFLLERGERIESLGVNLGLEGACFHGHWRLCHFLLEQGADSNRADPVNGETPLHAALCKADPLLSDRVLEVLLAFGANPNVATIARAETEGFMRDSRTRGETPLHRAAAFGGASTIRLLVDAGARLDAKDAHGDTPLSWASWYLRPNEILRPLLYGNFRIHVRNQSMRANLIGRSTPSSIAAKTSDQFD